MLSVLVAYILADVLLVSVLDQLREQGGLFSLQKFTANELAAVRVMVLSVLNPALAMTVSVVVIKSYLPGETIGSRLNRFGFKGQPTTKLLIASFMGGVVYVLLFSKGLMYFFPPDQFAAPHPAEVINSASLSGKILFSLGVVAIAPVGEEFLFRGVLYGGLAQSWNKWAAGLVVSVAFICIHPGAIESGYWLTHLALYIFTFLLILVRETTGTLFGSVMMHSGYNFGVVFF